MVLKGALYFAADLLRALRVPVEMDLIELSTSLVLNPLKTADLIKREKRLLRAFFSPPWLKVRLGCASCSGSVRPACGTLSA